MRHKRHCTGGAPPLCHGEPTISLRSARIFLAHSCRDHALADPFHDVLAQEFYVHYDHRSPDELLTGPDYHLGNLPIRRDLLVPADFVVLLASPASFRAWCYALRELEIADNNLPGLERRLGIVALDDFAVPQLYVDALFERCRPGTMREDATRIRTSIRQRLLRLAGCQDAPGGTLRPGVVTEYLERCLTGPCGPRVYPLALLYPRTETESLVDALSRVSGAERDRLASGLVGLYLRPPPEAPPIVRTNSAYLLSRVFPGEVEIARQLRRAPPPVEDTFAYRSFQVALSFLGDAQALEDFVPQLQRPDGASWRRHRTFNAEFHSFYYGSTDMALQVLRAEIRALTPPNLLPLDIASLGAMSADGRDAELLEEMQEQLAGCGTEVRLLQQARDSILRRMHRRRRTHRR